MIASAFTVKMLYTLTLEFKDIIGLSTRMDSIAYFSVNSRNYDLMTKCCLSKCKRYLTPYIIALTLEYIMSFHIYINVKIA